MPCTHMLISGLSHELRQALEPMKPPMHRSPQLQITGREVVLKICCAEDLHAQGHMAQLWMEEESI